MVYSNEKKRRALPTALMDMFADATDSMPDAVRTYEAAVSAAAADGDITGVQQAGLLALGDDGKFAGHGTVECIRLLVVKEAQRQKSQSRRRCVSAPVHRTALPPHNYLA